MRLARLAPSIGGYARGAAVAFSLVILYTLLAKVPSGQFGHDWMHTVLHVASGSVAVYAGWITDSAMRAKAFTVALAVTYGALGLFGWFADGLAMESAFRIPLDTGANVFHLALGVGAATTVVITAWTSRAHG